MMALRWHARDDVRLDDVEPPPPPAPGEVQIAVRACGICGTDVEEWRHGPTLIPDGRPHPLSGRAAPLTLGHELAGEVVAVGEGVEVPTGVLVAVDGLISCGRCRECRRSAPNRCPEYGQVGLTSDGGLQPLVNVPAATSVPMAPGLPPEAGALAETLSVGVRALRQGRIVPGDHVAIVGGGAVGLLAAQAARSMGAHRITVVEPLGWRRQLALALGADDVVDPADRDPTGTGADLVVECSGRPAAVTAAIAAAGTAGRVVLVGIGLERPPLDAWDVVRQEKTVVGSFSHVCGEDFAGALALLAAGSIRTEGMLTWIPLDQSIDRGLAALADEPERYIKILVDPREP